MKRLLVIVAILIALLCLTTGSAVACRSCLYDSWYYVMEVSFFDQPARYISLGLWFGAFSADYDVACTERKLTRHIKPDETTDKYFSFWNKIAAHVPKVVVNCADRKYEPYLLNKMAVPLPKKGGSVFVHVGRHDIGDDEFNYSYSFDRLTIQSNSGKTPLAASLNLTLFLVGIKPIGGNLEGGWGLTHKQEPQIVLDKTVKLGSTGEYNFNFNQFVSNYEKNQEEIESQIAFVLRAEILQIDEEKDGATPGVLILTKTPKSR